MCPTSHAPRVESDGPVLAGEALDHAVPVLDGAEATAEKEQGRGAARDVDSVKLRVSGWDHELSGHGGRAFPLGMVDDPPEGEIVAAGMPVAQEGGTGWPRGDGGSQHPIYGRGIQTVGDLGLRFESVRCPPLGLGKAGRGASGPSVGRRPNGVRGRRAQRSGEAAA